MILGKLTIPKIDNLNESDWTIQNMSTTDTTQPSINVETGSTGVFGVDWHDHTLLFTVGGFFIAKYTLDHASFELINSEVITLDNTGLTGFIPQGLRFVENGTRLIIVLRSSSVYTFVQFLTYDLTTYYDLSTLTNRWTGSFTVDLSTRPLDVEVDENSGGIFVLGDRTTSGRTVYRFNNPDFETYGFDLSSAGYSRSSTVTSGIPTDAYSFSFPSPFNGTRVHFLTSTNTFSYYSLVTNYVFWDMISISNSGITHSQATKLYRSKEGYEGYVLTSWGVVHRVLASGTKYQQIIDATAGVNMSTSISEADLTPQAIYIRPQGDYMYVVGATSDTVYEYKLWSKFNVFTKELITTLNVGSLIAIPEGIFFSPVNHKMYIANNGNDRVLQYDAPYSNVGFSILSDMVYANKFLACGTQGTVLAGMWMDSSGTKLFTIDNGADRVFQYTLATAWEINTATYDNISLDVSGQESVPTGIFLSPLGTKLFIVGQNSDNIREYSLSTPFNVSTASYIRGVAVGSLDGTPRDLAFSSNAKLAYIVGNTNDRVYQIKNF